MGWGQASTLDGSHTSNTVVHLVSSWPVCISEEEVSHPLIPDPRTNLLVTWKLKDPWVSPVFHGLWNVPIGRGHAWLDLPKPHPQPRHSSAVWLLVGIGTWPAWQVMAPGKYEGLYLSTEYPHAQRLYLFLKYCHAQVPVKRKGSYLLLYSFPESGVYLRHYLKGMSHQIQIV